MQYLGIDIAKHGHVAGARREDGTPHGKAFEFANDQAGFKSLLCRMRELGCTPDDTLVVMESTGHYWLALWEFLSTHGLEVAVVNPVLTDAKASVGTTFAAKVLQLPPSDATDFQSHYSFVPLCRQKTYPIPPESILWREARDCISATISTAPQ